MQKQQGCVVMVVGGGRLGGCDEDESNGKSDWWDCVVNVNSDSVSRICRLIARTFMGFIDNLLRVLGGGWPIKAEAFCCCSSNRQTNKAINWVETRSEWKIDRNIYIMLIKAASFFPLTWRMELEASLSWLGIPFIHVRLLRFMLRVAQKNNPSYS